MKTEVYYKQSDLNRLSELQKAADIARDNEYVKLFKGKENEFLSILIKNILKKNDFKKIKDLVSDYNVSVKEMDLDMLRVLYSGSQKDYESLNDYWKNEVRHMGKSVLKEIPFKIAIDYSENNVIHEDYEFHLKLFQELDIRY